MSTYFYLVNHSKKQIVSFDNLPVTTIKEIASNPVSSAIVTWYLYENLGDNITFISEYDENFEVYYNGYKEMTHQIIDSLIHSQISIAEQPTKLYVFDSNVEEDKNCWYWNIKLKN